MFFAVCDDFLFRQGIIFRHHKHFNFFAHGLVRNSYGGGFLDFWMTGEKIVNLFWINIFPAADNHVFYPINNEYITVFILDAHVTGMQISIDDCFSGFLGLIEVADHDIVALDYNFSAFIGRLFVALLIKNFYFLAGKRKSDGTDFPDAVPGIDGADAGAFGESVTFHNGNGKCLLEIVHGLLC